MGFLAEECIVGLKDVSRKRSGRSKNEFISHRLQSIEENIVIKVQWHTGYILGCALIIGLVFRYATNIGLILFISLLLALLLQPVKCRLEKRFSAEGAAFLALVFFIGIAALAIAWIVNTLVPGLQQFVVNVPDLVNPQKISLWIISLNLPPEFMEYANQLMDNAQEFAINAVKSSLLPAVQALSGIVELIGIPFITFYFLKDGRELKRMMVSFVPPQEHQKMLSFFDEVDRVLGGYIKGQLAVCLLSGVSVFFFFLLFELPYAAVFAAIIAAGELIPVFGPLTAAVFAVMFAMTISFATAIKVALFYFVMLQITDNIVYPSLIGKAIQLHPVIILSGLLLFGSLYGVLGMIMAVPAMGVARVALERIVPKHDKEKC